MLSNMLNDLAEAMKALDGKKCIVTWKIKPFSICFALVFAGEVHEGIVRRS